MSSSEHEAWFDRFADGMRQHEGARESVPLEGRDLGRYQLQNTLGEGSFAVVFRAEDKELNRTVAVKVLKEVAAIDPVVQKRFVREAQVVARISHPNVVTVHDVGTTGDISYLVMEFVEGQALSSALKSDQLGLQDKVEILEKVALGVHAAHEEGIIHRDLKPANILLTRHGEPKVADFGLAHVHGPETQLTRSGATLGTPAYMSPEQVRGDTKSISQKTDIYALGVVLYEMITGRYAYTATTPVELYGKIIEEDPLPPRQIKSDLSSDLETVCLKAMNKEISQRYETARAFAEDLARYRKGERILARPPSTIHRFRRAFWKRKGITLPILAASIALMLTLAFLLPRLQKATQGQGAAEKEAIAAGEEKERLKQEAEKRRRALRKARPYVDEMRRIRSRIDRELMNKNVTPRSFLALFEEGKALLEKALQEHPGYAEAYLELGRLARMAGRPVNISLTYFNQAIETDPTLTTGYIERTNVLLFKYFELRFDSLIRRLPPTPESKALLIRIQADLDQIRKWSRNQRELKFAEGTILMIEEQYDKAASLLREYAEETVSDPRAWKWLSLTELEREKLELAIETANNGILYRPWDHTFYTIRQSVRNRLAIQFTRKGDPEKASAMWKAALSDAEMAAQIQDKEPTALCNLGIARGNTGDFEGAIEIYKKVL